LATIGRIGEIVNVYIRRLLELEGLGAEIWKNVDAQKYVDDLRDEWYKRL